MMEDQDVLSVHSQHRCTDSDCVHISNAVNHTYHIPQLTYFALGYVIGVIDCIMCTHLFYTSNSGLCETHCQQVPEFLCQFCFQTSFRQRSGAFKGVLEEMGPAST